MRPFVLFGLLIGVCLMGAPYAAAQTPETLKNLITWRICQLSSELMMVYQRPGYSSSAPESERFFVVSVEKNPRAYVRCRFAEDHGRFFCEASQAYYEEGTARQPNVYLTRPRIEALERLGFVAHGATDNLTYERELSPKPDFDAITTFILTALHDGLGVREETDLDVSAPFAGSLVTACRY